MLLFCICCKKCLHNPNKNLFPSPRAIMNKLLAMRSVYHPEEEMLYYREYVSTSPVLFSRLMSIPTDRMVAGVYIVACDMWLSLASITKNIDMIVNVTTTCLSRKTFLDNDRIYSFR